MYEPLALLETLDFLFDFASPFPSFALFIASSWTMICFVFFPCHCCCGCEQRSLSEKWLHPHSKQPSRGLAMQDARAMIASTSIGSVVLAFKVIGVPSEHHRHLGAIECSCGGLAGPLDAPVEVIGEVREGTFDSDTFFWRQRVKNRMMKFPSAPKRRKCLTAKMEMGTSLRQGKPALEGFVETTELWARRHKVWRFSTAKTLMKMLEIVVLPRCHGQCGAGDL